MTTQDVDPETYYAVGKGLFEKAGTLYDAFNVNVALLGDTGSMAGTDDAGTAWAASYDARAVEVLGAVNVAGVLSAPPSAGGPGKGLVDAIGLMQQVGVPVPDGDTDKLSKATDAWDRVATVYQTRTVVEALEVDTRAFGDTQSPEVEYIVRDLEQLRDATASVLDGCAELAQSCRDYESALDDLRTQLENILKDLAIELAVTAAVAIAASFVSFGAGAIAGTAKAAHSITKFAQIIAEAVGAWKLSKNIATGVKKVHDIAVLRQKLQRIKNLGRKGKPEDAPLGPGVQRASETPLTTSRSQIEKKFDKHAADFGVTESRGKAGFDEFEQAIRSQIHDPATIHVNGSYRGDPAIINYNPNTGLAVIQKPSGEFVSGWRLSPEQAANVLQRGSLR